MTNEDLIERIIKSGELVTPRIIDAFSSIDRADFVPQKYKESAYIDEPISLGFGVTISQPFTIAFMLEKLQPEAGEKILEVGAGSGYLTALLAHIVGQNGVVFAFEYIPEVKKIAEKNLKKYDFKNIKLIEGDAKNGIPQEAPFDKIIASAEARKIPEMWKEQLEISGKLITAFDGKLRLMEKISQKEFKTEDFLYFSFVELK